MNYLRFIAIFLLFSFFVHADQNDQRLDKLFLILSYSQDNVEMNKAILDIWNIWLETNDPIIENDFKKGLELMQNGQLESSIVMFTKVIEKKPIFAEAWNKRATVHYLLGDFDSSILDIKETLKREWAPWIANLNKRKNRWKLEAEKSEKTYDFLKRNINNK